MRARLALLFTVVLPFGGSHAVSDVLSEFSLEELGDIELSHTPLNVDASTSAKLAQTVQGSPSNVHIATAEDIRHFGYRTLGEILNAMPGLYTTSDGLNTYLGVRGFGRPGDYNTRVLILVDGVRVNDNVFDSALVGNEFPVDVALIERVEYAPGPGAAVYGNNAFFGVINVFTKSGHLVDGVEFEVGAGSHNSRDVRLSYGKRLSSGAEFLFSGSSQHSSDVYSHVEPQFADYDSDKEQGHSLFAKFNYKSFQAGLSYAKRRNQFHVSSDASLENHYDQFDDQKLLVNAQYDWRFNSQWGLVLSATYGDMNYGEFSPYLDAESLLRYDYVTEYSGSWLTGDARLSNYSFDRHRIIVGLELQRNINMHHRSYFQGYAPDWDNQGSSYSYALYAQDEFSINEALTLLAGLRYDHTERLSDVNPRLALIWQATAQRTFKFLYGSAFRAANFYENDYNQQDAIYNPSSTPPDAEKIQTTELVIDQYLPQYSSRASASLYYYRVKNIIEEVWYYDYDAWYSYFENGQAIDAYGLELDFEKRFVQGHRLDVNYTLQQSDDGQGRQLSNSPEHSFNLRHSTPVWWDKLRIASELRYVSERSTDQDETLDDYWLLNLNAHLALAAHVELAASIKNVTDTTYFDTSRSGTYQQLGRSFHLQAEARF